MGCGSSKLLIRSLSFQEEVKRRLEKRPKGGDHILALLRSANPVSSKSIATPTPSQELKEEEEEKSSSDPPPVDDGEMSGNVEVINTWELLAGLEDEEEAPVDQETRSETDDYKFIVRENSSEEERAKEEKTEKRCSKREAMARELAALKVPPAAAFEFSKSGSLREWLKRGGQVTSPGSYVTPKFGSFPGGGKKDRNDRIRGEIRGDDDDGDGELVVFDPEMVAQFERAMVQLATDEELVLQQITDDED